MYFRRGLKKGRFQAASRASARVGLAVVLALSACATQPNLDDEPVNAVFDVRQMLHQRARALSKGDASGYLKPLTPEARAAEEPIARGALAVPLTDINLVFTPSESTGLGATSFSDVPTKLLFRYKGLPRDNVFYFSLLYDVQKRKGSWVVTESKIDTSQGPAPMWATGPVETRSSPHFLALNRPGLEGVAEALKLAEEARANLLPKLTLAPDNKSLLLLARDHAEFQAIEGEPLGEGVLALAGFQSRDGGLPSRYILVNSQAVTDDPDRVVAGHSGDLSAKAVYQHELGHLALLRYGGPVIPGWLAEGAAMYLSGERREQAWAHMDRQGLLEKDLSEALIAPPVTGGGALAGALYPYANAAVLYLVESFGPKRFWTFYSAFRQQDFESGSLEEAQAAATRKLLKDIYKVDPQTLDRDVRAYIKSQIRGS